MKYTFTIIELNDDLTNEDLYNLIVFGDESGLVNDVEQSNNSISYSMKIGDIVTLETIGKIDPLHYEILSDEQDKTILFMESV